MARQITAQRTRSIISYGREALDDIGYTIFKTEDELFSALNECVNEICREAHVVIEPDIVFDLVPNQVEYNTIDLADTPQNILQVRSITIVNPDGSESQPLKKLARADFQKIRTTTHTFLPQFYDFDGQRIYIWKPYGIIGYRIKLRANRLPSAGEQASYEVDPPTPLQYDEYLKPGLVYKAGSRKVGMGEKINLEYFRSEYMKFMRAKAKPMSIETDHIPFNELNSIQ